MLNLSIPLFNPKKREPSFGEESKIPSNEYPMDYSVAQNKSFQRPVDTFSLVNPELRLGVNSNLQKAIDAELFKNLAIKSRPLAEPVVFTQIISGVAGNPDVKVFVINAKPGTERPAILAIHGGGFTSGSANQLIADLQEEAKILDAAIVSVEYRLAPKTQYPGALEDNYTALKWLSTNAKRLGINPHKIALQGDSAGGGHAAMLAIAARNRGEIPIKFQMLLYPMLDDQTGTTKFPPSHIGTYAWTTESNRKGWAALLGKTAHDAQTLNGIIPSRVKDLRGLPPTFIGVGALDLFVQEDIEFAKQLMAAGVPTELLVLPGAYHGFDIIAPNANVSKQFTQAKYQALARAFND